MRTYTSVHSEERVVRYQHSDSRSCANHQRDDASLQWKSEGNSRATHRYEVYAFHRIMTFMMIRERLMLISGTRIEIVRRGMDQRLQFKGCFCLLA